MNIYYFSGTGNSLMVAKNIAEKLNSKAIPIASIINGKYLVNINEGFGIVFPRYYGSEIGIPIIVKKFINVLINIKSTYIFAICTYGGGFGNALQMVDSLLKERGGKLSDGYGIHMPQNAFNKPWVNNKKLIEKCNKKIEIICSNVGKERIQKYENPKLFFTAFVKLINPIIKPMIIKSIANCANMDSTEPFEKIVKNADNAFYTNDQCNGCEICKKICPVSNIIMENKKPKWMHKCENCLACYNWCPKKAILTGIAETKYYYRNPNVELSDFLDK
jgi:formate hydrogenlyase subunit 6/NADH:ubiquinone oxidoreductase subunit I